MRPGPGHRSAARYPSRIATSSSPQAQGRVRVLAHRGDTTTAPENTIAAFLAAADAGADGVELDVRRTRDGALVVLHDPAVAGVGAVSEAALRDLPAAVALLDEALWALAGLVVNVEIKNDPKEPGYDPSGSLAHAVVAQLAEHDTVRVVVSSFDLPTLDHVRQASATVETGWLLGHAADPLDAVEVAVAHGVGALHPFVLTLHETAVVVAHDAGLEVTTWTVNARHDLERTVTLGVDTVITDDVALALAVLAAQAPGPNGVTRPASA